MKHIKKFINTSNIKYWIIPTINKKLFITSLMKVKMPQKNIQYWENMFYVSNLSKYEKIYIYKSKNEWHFMLNEPIGDNYKLVKEITPKELKLPIHEDFNFIKTPEDFEQLKKDFSDKIDIFLKEYWDFLSSVSPSDWKSNIYKTLERYKDEILPKLKPFIMKDLESDIIRKEVLSPEEQKLWNDINKYNL